MAATLKLKPALALTLSARILGFAVFGFSILVYSFMLYKLSGGCKITFNVL